MRFNEIEKILIKDGWKLKAIKGSHYQYTHLYKKGKVTVPNHRGDIPKITIKSILKQAQIEEESK